jgi:hypothetical protein
MIKVHYNDESVDEYNSLEDAEEGILLSFAESDNNVVPIYVEEVDANDKQLAVFGCTWKVTLEKQE